jgi:hypothetical protein
MTLLALLALILGMSLAKLLRRPIPPLRHPWVLLFSPLPEVLAVFTPLEKGGTTMRQEHVLKVAKELARKGELEGLRLWVRAAALPLMAEAMLANGRDMPHFLDHAIPESIIRAMEFHGVEVRYGPPKGLTLDLAKDTVVSFPWHTERMEKALANIGKTRWKYDEVNHKVYYYRPIGVGFFTNGLHSGAVGILKGEGKVPATEVDLAPLYAAGFGIEWQDGVALAVFRDKVVPMDHPHHALLLALGEVLHRYGLSL